MNRIIIIVAIIFLLASGGASCNWPSYTEWINFKASHKRNYNYPEDLQRYLLFADAFRRDQLEHPDQQIRGEEIIQFADWTEDEIETYAFGDLTPDQARLARRMDKSRRPAN